MEATGNGDNLHDDGDDGDDGDDDDGGSRESLLFGPIDFRNLLKPVNSIRIKMGKLEYTVSLMC